MRWLGVTRSGCVSRLPARTPSAGPPLWPPDLGRTEQGCGFSVGKNFREPSNLTEVLILFCFFIFTEDIFFSLLF